MYKLKAIGKAVSFKNDAGEIYKFAEQLEANAYINLILNDKTLFVFTPFSKNKVVYKDLQTGEVRIVDYPSMLNVINEFRVRLNKLSKFE